MKYSSQSIDQLMANSKSWLGSLALLHTLFYSLQAELERQIEAWQQRRNQKAVTVDWRFTTKDARIKLKYLYPSIEP